MVEKKTGLDWVLDILNTALLILIGLACLYPFWYVVCASFSDANEFLRHDFVLLLKPLKIQLGGLPVLHYRSHFGGLPQHSILCSGRYCHQHVPDLPGGLRLEP